MPSTVQRPAGLITTARRTSRSGPGPWSHIAGRAVELSSYDTRLVRLSSCSSRFFPLKRLRIVDYCSACTRHYAMEADIWETAKQLEVSGAMEKVPCQSHARGRNGRAPAIDEFSSTRTGGRVFEKTMREKFRRQRKDTRLPRSGARAFLANSTRRRLVTPVRSDCASDLPEARVGVARWLHSRGENSTTRASCWIFSKNPGRSAALPA